MGRWNSRIDRFSRCEHRFNKLIKNFKTSLTFLFFFSVGRVTNGTSDVQIISNVSGRCNIKEKSEKFNWWISREMFNNVKIKRLFFLIDLEFLQPYKTRPQTSSLTANRRICAALGLKNPMSNDKTRTERQKIEAARRKTRKRRRAWRIFAF